MPKNYVPFLLPSVGEGYHTEALIKSATTMSPQALPDNRNSREVKDSREFRESARLWKKGESDHFLENLEILEMPEIPPAKRPLSQ